jgi:hypothetical protein
LNDVAAFLADAGDEGLTWEVKGTERPHPGSVRKHVCAFANSSGGFFIVGASREGRRGPWKVDPVDFLGDEPGPWLSKVIRNGLRPVPQYDVREWPVDSKRLAVVNIDAVSEPPCMTSTGEVFVRVSGESHRVDDPTTLRRLYEQGEARAEGAETEALGALRFVAPYALRRDRRRPRSSRIGSRGVTPSRSIRTQGPRSGQVLQVGTNETRLGHGDAWFGRD